MSDFLYISKQQNKGKLSSLLKQIYIDKNPGCLEYHGEWGSLAVLENHYFGFDPYENDRHIIFIIGGPFLKFSSMSLLDKRKNNKKTEAIYKKWKLDNDIHWDQDISGPFLVGCINKQLKNIEIITDLMSFIPIYFCALKDKENSTNVLGTHVDIVSIASGRNKDFDYTSIADLLINKRVIFPHTIYKSVQQLDPGTSYIFNENPIFTKNSYWIPREKSIFRNISEAAKAINKHLLRIINSEKAFGYLLSNSKIS